MAKEPGTTVVTAGARPGEAYRPRAWETNQDVIALLDSGDHEGAKRLLVAALDQYEDRGGLLYNLACAEAQLGETDAAVEHIQAAILERPDFAAPAREDDDLAPIRDDPRFVQAVGS